MTDVLIDTGTADVVNIYEPADLLVEVRAYGGVSVLELTPTVGAVLVLPGVDTSGVVEVATPGPQGVQGVVGDTGEIGATGPSPSFDQVFAEPLMQWVIMHPLNTHPVVTTVDQNGEEIIGDVMFPDNSTVIVSFGIPFAGTARLKA